MGKSAKRIMQSVDKKDLLLLDFTLKEGFTFIINPFNLKFENVGTFGTLKVACLLLGVGSGLLAGFFICQVYVYGFIPNININHDAYEISGVIYGASVLLFGGLGLLIAFLIEMKYRKDKKED